MDSESIEMTRKGFVKKICCHCKTEQWMKPKVTLCELCYDDFVESEVYDF